MKINNEYQSYSHNTKTYGVIFQNLEKAKAHSQSLSAMCRCGYDVVDRNTGEIMAQYNSGNLTYESGR